jgi:hypothetical protein
VKLIGRSTSGHDDEEISVDIVLPASTSLEGLFKTTGKPLLDAALEGIKTSCMMYGRLDSCKGRDLLDVGVEVNSMLRQAACAMFDAASRLQDAMNSSFTFQVSVVDIQDDRVYDLGVGFPCAAAGGSTRPPPISTGAITDGSKVASSVIVSELSATGLVSVLSQGPNRNASEEELAKFRDCVIELRRSGDEYQAEKLTIKTVRLSVMAQFPDGCFSSRIPLRVVVCIDLIAALH